MRGLLVACLLVGCAAAPVERAGAPLAGAPVLVAHGAVAVGPEGSDAAPVRRVAFRMEDGALRDAGDAIAFVPRWGMGAALVDPRRRLFEVRPDGTRRMLAEGATGSLAVAPPTRGENEGLLYVTARDVLGSLHVHDGERERVVAEGLASIGALRVIEDEVLFVGARPGGVAGLWSASLEGDGARCLTNCELTVGTDWQGAFVASPASLDAIDVAGPTLVWMDEDGVRHEVAR